MHCNILVVENVSYKESCLQPEANLHAFLFVSSFLCYQTALLLPWIFTVVLYQLQQIDASIDMWINCNRTCHVLKCFLKNNRTIGGRWICSHDLCILLFSAREDLPQLKNIFRLKFSSKWAVVLNYEKVTSCKTKIHVVIVQCRKIKKNRLETISAMI